ncbi:MAG: hypothetical protein ABSH38_12305 [Verrucomicrobiota bacterium]|jgi:hypothetical protein
MFRRLRHTVIAAAGFFGLAAALWAGSGYLPTVGPIPLRFRALPLLSTNLASLPAPLPSDSTETEGGDINASNAPQPLVIPPLAGANADAAKADIMEVSSAPLLVPAPAPPLEPVVSPQMLIQYFLPSTNGPASGMGAPVGFLPPPPPAAPAAKAAP